MLIFPLLILESSYLTRVYFTVLIAFLLKHFITKKNYTTFVLRSPKSAPSTCLSPSLAVPRAPPCLSFSGSPFRPSCPSRLSPFSAHGPPDALFSPVNEQVQRDNHLQSGARARMPHSFTSHFCSPQLVRV